MCRKSQTVLIAGLFLFSAFAWAQSACDLNADAAANVIDVQLATNMALGTPCTAKIIGAGFCNATVVNRVRDAALGGSCVAGLASPYVKLTWTPSTSTNVRGYNIYRRYSWCHSEQK